MLPRRWLNAAMLGVLGGVGGPAMAQTVAAQAATIADGPTCAHSAWRFTDNIVLHIPGSSRFAGDVYGADSVRAHLMALGELVAPDSAPVQLYTTADGRQLALSRATIQVGDARRVQRHVRLIAIPTFDGAGHVTSIDVFIDDLPTFDRRAPRDDGTHVVSLAMQRNLEQVRALYGRGGAARFIAANAHQVVVMLNATDADGTRGVVMRYQFDAAGRVKQVEQFAPSGLVSMALRTTGR